MKVTVIIPTYNERDNITTLLDKLSTVTKSITNHRFCFLVVDDNSPDLTPKVVKDYQKTHDSVFLLTGEKYGLGKALLRGITHAITHHNADIIAQMDADLSHDPDTLPEFLRAYDGGSDFVVGSRYIRGGSIPDNWAIHRKIFSRVGNAIVRYGLGYLQVHDWTGGYRVFDKKYFVRAKDTISSYSGYVFQIAFLHTSIQNGARVAEVPILFTDRRFGHSKIAPSQYIRDVLLYVCSARLQQIRSSHFIKFCIVGAIGFIINTIGLEVVVMLGFHPVVGSTIGAELAILSNFWLNNTWTFYTRKITGRKYTVKKFLQFNGASIGAILLQVGIVAWGTWILGVETYRYFYAVGVAVGLVWNYLMYSRIIWKKR